MADDHEVIEVLKKLGQELEMIRDSLERIERMQYIRQGITPSEYHPTIAARLRELDARLHD